MSENGENRLNITCFICQKGVENDNEPTVVFERGIEKLRNVSIERKDERHKIIADVNCTKVHIKCRKKYTDKSGGKFKYNYTIPDTNAWKYSPAKKKLRRSFEGSFEFHLKCFICGHTYDKKQIQLYKVT